MSETGVEFRRSIKNDLISNTCVCLAATPDLRRMYGGQHVDRLVREKKMSPH